MVIFFSDFRDPIFNSGSLKHLKKPGVTIKMLCNYSYVCAAWIG